MNGFIIRLKDNTAIRFNYYLQDAPHTCAAFDKALPFSNSFMHARVSGQEIWIDDAPGLDVIQENASVFTEPGEVVIGPLKPARTMTAKCMGIYYGPGKGLDCCNIFARVWPEDATLLEQLGNRVWKEGLQELRFERLPVDNH